MTRHSLKQKIDQKFGSWHNFARIVGLETLKGKTPLEIDRIADGLSRRGAGGSITPSKLKRLREAVNASGGVSAFCAANREFSEISVFQILQGRRKRLSPVVARLFNHFGI